MRLAQGVSQSLDKVVSSQEQFNVAKNDLHQTSEVASIIYSQSASLKRNLSQQFVDWGCEREGRGAFTEKFSQGEEMGDLAKEFIESKFALKNDVPKNFVDPETAYENFAHSPISEEGVREKHAEFYQQHNREVSSEPGHIQKEREAISQRHANMKQLEQMKQADTYIKNKFSQKNAKEKMDEEWQKSNLQKQGEKMFQRNKNK